MADNIPVVGGGDGPTDLVLEYHGGSIGFIARYYVDDFDFENDYPKDTYWAESEEKDPEIPPGDPPEYLKVYDGTSDSFRDYGGVDWINKEGDIMFTYGSDKDKSGRYDINPYATKEVFSYGEKAFEPPYDIYGVGVWEHEDIKTGEKTKWLNIVCHFTDNLQLLIYTSPFKGVGAPSSSYPRAQWKKLLTISTGTVAEDSFSYFNFNKAGNKAIAVHYKNSEYDAGISRAVELEFTWNDQVVPGEPKVEYKDDLKIVNGITYTGSSSSGVTDGVEWGESSCSSNGEILFAADYRYYKDPETDEEDEEETVVYAYQRYDNRTQTGSWSCWSENPCTVEGNFVAYRTLRREQTQTYSHDPDDGLYIDGIGPIPLTDASTGTESASSTGTRQFSGDCVYDDDETEWETTASSTYLETDWIELQCFDLRYGIAGWVEYQYGETWSARSYVGEEPRFNVISHDKVNAMVIINKTPLRTATPFSVLPEPLSDFEIFWPESTQINRCSLPTFFARCVHKDGDVQQFPEWSGDIVPNRCGALPSGSFLTTLRFYNYVEDRYAYYSKIVTQEEEDGRQEEIDPYEFSDLTTDDEGEPVVPIIPDPIKGVLLDISILNE